MPTGKRHITYDSTNQLVSAANPQTYALSVTYGDWGKIQQYGKDFQSAKAIKPSTLSL